MEPINWKSLNWTRLVIAGHGNVIDNGWDVMVHNIDTQGRQTTAIAICAQ